MSGSYWPCTRSGWCCRPLNNSPLFSLLPAITIHPNIVEDRLVRGRRADCDAVISHQTSMITAVPAITIHPNDRGGRAHAWVRGVLSVLGLQLSRCVDGVTTVRGSRRAPGMRSASGGRTRSTLQWSVHEVRASATKGTYMHPQAVFELHFHPHHSTFTLSLTLTLTLNLTNSRCASRFLLSRTPPSSSSSTRASASTE